MYYICKRIFFHNHVTMLNSKEFSKRLGKILDFYGLTASALAEEIDFNRSTISHLVSGRNKPSLEFVMKLLQKFPEIEMDWLVQGKGTFPSSSTSKAIEVNSKTPPSPPLTSPKKSMDSLIETIEKTNSINSTKSNHQKIERIVIFFKDGTFKVYEN